MSQTGQLPFATRICYMDALLEEQVSATQGVAKDQMAALAAELEAELELMELNLYAGLDQSLVHDAGEVCNEGMQKFSLINTSSCSQCMVEASNVGRRSALIQASLPEYGVSPIELEHRLQEVLEAQQQERILELEQLLRETEAKLVAKEHEILGWKNHVNSLANLVQCAPACETYVHNLVNGDGAESADIFVADAPEVTKNTLEMYSFQDPCIATQLEFQESPSNSNTWVKAQKQEINRRSHSPPGVFFNNGNSSSEASYISTASHEGSLVRESNCCWDGQHGSGNDTPVLVVLDELNARITAQKAESVRGKAVSKALEIDSRLLHDDVDACVSSHGVTGHSDSSLIAKDGEHTAASGIKLNPSSFPHLSCKTGMIKNSPSLFPFEKSGEDASDIKHSVSSFKPNPDLDNWKIVQEGTEAPKRVSKSKNESLQIVTRSLRRAISQNGSLEGTSPVLDKIRHYEALVRSEEGKRF